jgi:hypothetical protein
MLPSTRELAKGGKKGFVCSMIDHGTRDPWIGVLVTPELKAALQHMKTGTMNVHHGRGGKSPLWERERCKVTILALEETQGRTEN